MDLAGWNIDSERKIPEQEEVEPTICIGLDSFSRVSIQSFELLAYRISDFIKTDLKGIKFILKRINVFFNSPS